MLDRNERRLVDLVCRCKGCGKVCKSKGVLVQHQKRTHRPPNERVRYQCSRCGLLFDTEVACLMHERLCAGGSVEGNKLEYGYLVNCPPTKSIPSSSPPVGFTIKK